MVRIDHIALIVRNLYEGCHRFREETGLDNYDGGWGEGYGIGIRIVPLGGDNYLEIESVIECGKEKENPIAAWFHESTEKGDCLIGWCARVDTEEELHRVAERLGTPVLPGVSRIRPKLGQPSPHALMTPLTPDCWKAGVPNFFWFDNMESHPSRLDEGQRHSVEPKGIAWLEVGGDPDHMREWLGGDNMITPVLRFVDREPGLYAFAVRSDNGEIVVRR